MDADTARGLLGLASDLSVDAIHSAHAERRKAIEERLSTTPTEALRKKYEQSLAELDSAHAALLAAAQPRTPNLSHTQFQDLPSAKPAYTEHGLSGSAGASSLNRLRPGLLLAQRYELRQQIGVGGMGAVYSAFDRNRNEEIAVKVLLPHLLSHPLARERFLAEAKIASSLSHPHIVNVFDVQKDGEYDFLTMELLHGQNLRQLMNARKAARQPFSPGEAFEIAKAIGSALDYAHRFTVHRDVKPENIWVDEEGVHKLMDFGIARLMSNSQLTATSTAMGTAYYMAPEQLKAAKSVDGRADQYSLGVMLYELLSGDVPAGRVKSLRHVRKDIPAGLSAAVDRALEPDPTARFPSMAEFVKALQVRALPFNNRQLAYGGGILGSVALAALLWSVGPSLIPDRKSGQELRSQAIQSQSVIETLIKRIEVAERDLDTTVRDAKSAVDRFDSMLRMARSDAERRDLDQRLDAAKAEFELVSEINSLSTTWAFRSDDLAKARGQLALGSTALRDGDFEQAATELSAAQAKLEHLLDVPEAARAAIAARADAARALKSFEDFAKREDRDLTLLAAAQAQQAAAQTAMTEGRFRDAVAAYGSTRTESGKAKNALIDSLVKQYGDVARRAMEAQRLDVARVAVQRAKDLSAMKTDAP